jgi:long-chain fatty acid transport protein
VAVAVASGGAETGGAAKMKCQLALALWGVLWLGIVAARSAETLAVVPDSAEALGLAGGRYANLRDASTARVNPANMTYAGSPQLLVNAAVWRGDVRFDSANGGSLVLGDATKFLGSIYYVHPVWTNRLAFGLGVSTPYGLDSDYSPTGSLRYLVPSAAQLLTLDFTPAVAFKPIPELSVAAGLEIMYSQLSLQQFFPWAAVSGQPDPEGKIRFEGDGHGVGAYAGTTWEMTMRQRLSIVGRLPLRVKYEGDFKTTGLPASLQAAGLRERSSFRSEVTFPGSLALGYGVDVAENLMLGVDFQWARNSSHDDVPLIIGANQPLVPARGVELDWKDSIDTGFGLAWRWRESWVLRGGYLFSANSQPSRTYTPAVPSNDRHLFSGGLGWRGRRHSLDLTYAYAFFPDRSVTGASQPAFNGNYRIRWHIVNLSYSHRF